MLGLFLLASSLRWVDVPENYFRGLGNLSWSGAVVGRTSARNLFLLFSGWLDYAALHAPPGPIFRLLTQLPSTSVKSPRPPALFLRISHVYDVAFMCPVRSPRLMRSTLLSFVASVAVE